MKLYYMAKSESGGFKRRYLTKDEERILLSEKKDYLIGYEPIVK